MGNSTTSFNYLRKRLLYNFPKFEFNKNNDNSNNNIHDIGRKAIVLGATGATGRFLVHQLLKSNQWSKVNIIHRRKLDLDELAKSYGELTKDETSKVEQNVIDMYKTLENVQVFEGGYDVCFCVIGSESSKLTAEEFRKIDLHMVHDAAKAAKQANVPHFSLLTSQGSSKDLWANDWTINRGLLYLKVKGQAEQAVIDVKLPRTSIFRPGFLERPGTTRGKEKFASVFMTGFHVRDLARIMIYDAESDQPEPGKIEPPLFYESKQCIGIAGQFKYDDKNIDRLDYKQFIRQTYNLGTNEKNDNTNKESKEEQKQDVDINEENNNNEEQQQENTNEEPNEQETQETQENEENENEQGIEEENENNVEKTEN